MNRAERRRQKSQTGGTGFSESQQHLQAWFRQAVSYYQQGQLTQAEELYDHILQAYPDHAETWHLLGLIKYKSQNFEQAKEYIERAIRYNSNKPQYFFNLGLVAEARGEPTQAITAYQRAIRLKPDYVEAHSNLGNMFREQGDLLQAVSSYQQAVNLRPGYAGGLNNLGVAFKEQGKKQEAIRAYQSAIEADPRYAEAHWNLGIVLQEQGDLDDAIEVFQSAIQVKPNYAKAHHSLGLTWLWKQHLDLAFEAFRRSAELTRNHGRILSIPSIYKSRIKHDLEQVQYLYDKEIFGKEFTPYFAMLKELHQRARETGDPGGMMSLTSAEVTKIQPSLNRILYYAASPALPGGALNPNLDVEEIQRRYYQTQPEILYVDDLLTEEAVCSLRRFCWKSTIWKKDYDNGYIGAMLGEGFSSPLLLQISEELRVRFPKIFGQHRLVQSWAFKQDSQLKGLNIHADAAAVNVNFWITENSANLDPSSGGLVVWDKEAPRDWNFKDYNSVQYKPKIHEFLERSQAKAVTIPYRENRAVIFNSDLFHETDRCMFKDEYESRRINITMLYGYRRATYSS